MTHDERSALIRRVVAEAKRERARMVRLILGAAFTLPHRAWTKRRASARLLARPAEPQPAR